MRPSSVSAVSDFPADKSSVSVLRVPLQKAPILILDDSTSALDMETEHEIQKTLNELKDTTKVIIAHRISAVCHRR